MLAHYEGASQAPDREWMARLKLVLAAPAIRGEYLKINSEMQEALAEAIASRTGTDMGQDMYPRILARAVIAAAQVAVRRWAAADPPVPLGPLLRQALEQLATACSQPPPAVNENSRYRPDHAIEAERVGPLPRCR